MPATTTPLVPITSEGTLYQYDTQGGANSGVVKASAGALADAVATNNGGSFLYLMIFDSATVPGNGTVPKFQAIPLPATATGTINFKELSLSLMMTHGICWAASTTATALTIDATSSLWVTITFS